MSCSLFAVTAVSGCNSTHHAGTSSERQVLWQATDTFGIMAQVLMSKVPVACQSFGFSNDVPACCWLLQPVTTAIVKRRTAQYQHLIVSAGQIVAYAACTNNKVCNHKQMYMCACLLLTFGMLVISLMMPCLAMSPDHISLQRLSQRVYCFMIPMLDSSALFFMKYPEVQGN